MRVPIPNVTLRPVQPGTIFLKDLRCLVNKAKISLAPFPLPQCVLAGLVLLAYLPATMFAFVNYDDPLYVVNNSIVRGGWSLSSVVWAFVTPYHGMWHPLTWLSLITDVSIFGIRAEGFHFVNVLLHAINVILVYSLLRRTKVDMTVAWVAAAIFALHPLNVESVAWISERKGLLCCICFLSAILVYLKHTVARSPLTYTVALLFGVGASFSKATAVMLPVVLLGTELCLGAPSGNPTPQRKMREAMYRIMYLSPFWCFALALGILTVWSESEVGALKPMSEISTLYRCVVCLNSYARGIVAFLMPGNLAVVYPRPDLIDLIPPVLSGSMMVIILAFATIRNTPAGLRLGVLIYVLTLLPASGLFAIGSHLTADRYTYLPNVGAVLVLAAIVQRWWKCQEVRIIALCWVAVLCVLMQLQLMVWRDDDALWSHAIKVTHHNIVAEHNLGVYLERRGEWERAERHFEREEEIRAHVKGRQL